MWVYGVTLLRLLHPTLSSSPIYSSPTPRMESKALHMLDKCSTTEWGRVYLAPVPILQSLFYMYFILFVQIEMEI